MPRREVYVRIGNAIRQTKIPGASCAICDLLKGGNEQHNEVMVRSDVRRAHHDLMVSVPTTHLELRYLLMLGLQKLHDFLLALRRLHFRVGKALLCPCDVIHRRLQARALA